MTNETKRRWVVLWGLAGGRANRRSVKESVARATAARNESVERSAASAGRSPCVAQARSKSTATPWPPPMAAPQLPDITERYQVMLGLPPEDVVPAGKDEMGGGEAADSAKIAQNDTDKLRAKLRTCSTLPGGKRVELELELPLQQ